MAQSNVVYKSVAVMKSLVLPLKMRGNPFISRKEMVPPGSKDKTRGQSNEVTGCKMRAREKGSSNK